MKWTYLILAFFIFTSYADQDEINSSFKEYNCRSLAHQYCDLNYHLYALPCAGEDREICEVIFDDIMLPCIQAFFTQCMEEFAS